MNDLQLLALSVYKHLELLQSSASVLGAGRLYREAEKNIDVCKMILGARILSAEKRNTDERRLLQKKVKAFQDLMLFPIPGVDREHPT